MLICDKTASHTKPCPYCDIIEDPEACSCVQKGALWVRAREMAGGKRLVGVTVAVDQHGERPTQTNGFAVFDPVEPSSPEVKLVLSENNFDKKYKAVAPQRPSVQNGQTVLVTFELEPKAVAKIEPSRTVVFVKGKEKKLTLSSVQGDFSGKGILTGLNEKFTLPGPQDVDVTPPGTLILKANDDAVASAGLDDIPLTWQLLAYDREAMPGNPDKATVTVVKAHMEPHWSHDDARLSASEKSTDGLVVFKNGRRAKVDVVVEPNAYDGDLKIKLSASTKLKIFDSDAGGTAKDELVISGSAARRFYLQGIEVSGSLGDVTVELQAEGATIDSFNVTVVIAHLEPYWPLNNKKLDAGKKLTDGLVVAKGGPRSKVDLVLEPDVAYKGELKIRLSERTKLEIFAADTGGVGKDELSIKASDPRFFYLQGMNESAAKQDITIALEAEGNTIDRFYVTVVKAVLVIHEDVKYIGGSRTHAAIAGSPPTRLLYNDVYHQLHRAKLLVNKIPWDAPCDLTITQSGQAVNLYQAGVGVPDGPGGAREMRTSETYNPGFAVTDTTGTGTANVPAETALTSPTTTHKVDAGGPETSIDFIGSEPVCLWVEAGTNPGSCDLKLAITDVQNDTSSVKINMRKPRLTIKVKREALSTETNAPTLQVTPNATGATALTRGLPAYVSGESQVEPEVDPHRYFIVVTPQGTEQHHRVTIPNPTSDEALVAVLQDTTVEYQLEKPYTQIQFIGYELVTGTYKGLDTDPFAWQMDNTKPDYGQLTPGCKGPAMADINGRCTIMKGAITAALGGANSLDTILKVFVAPEFFFRGKQGAYPEELLQEISSNLRTHVKTTAYKDWLFVCGSAIGFVEKTKDTSKGTATVTPAGPPPNHVYLESPANLSGLSPPWELYRMSGSTPTLIGTVNSATGVATNVYDLELTAATPAPPAAGESFLLFNSTFPPPNHVFRNIAYVQKLGVTAGPSPVTKGFGVNQGGVRIGFVAETITAAAPYELYVGLAPGAPTVTAGNVEIIDLGQTEIFNVVFVQRGGTGKLVTNKGMVQSELLVYKEHISSVDFEGVDKGTPLFNYPNRNEIELSNQKKRAVPTDGSRAVLGQNPNVPGAKPISTAGSPMTAAPNVSEETRTGLGGGSIFTLDGIRFGLEVCLDHGVGVERLAHSGAPPVDIQLIPSCGMSINYPGSVHVTANGFVFNVDGASNHHTVLQHPAGTTKTARTTIAYNAGNTDHFDSANHNIYVYPAENR